MSLRMVLCSSVAAVGVAMMAASAPVDAQPKPRTAAIAIGGRHRQRRHRRRGARRQGPRGRRLGDRRDHRPADPLHPQRRHRRPGPLRHPRPADRELRGVGARLWPRRFAEDARQARPEPRSDGGGGAERGGRRALLSGDLLVRDDEDSAGQGLRRLDRHPQEHHPRKLDPADEQHRLRRLSSARPGGDPHHPGAVRQVRQRRRRLDSPHPVRPGRRDDDQPHRRPVRRRALQVSRRLDRPRRQGRAAEEQAARVRPASSATSSSPPGTGRRPTSICTT